MNFIAYLRLSKQLTNSTQYGMTSQKEIIERFVASNYPNSKITEFFIEWETGSKKRKAVELNKALEKCSTTNSKLVVARIDRLGRDLHQITAILNSGVEFIAVETPNLDRFGLHILGAVAEKELTLISERIKKALAVCKANGVKLGADTQRAKEMSKKSVATRVKQADEFAVNAYKQIANFRNSSRTKLNNSQLADRMNRARHFTRNGCLWNSTQIARVLKRVEKLQMEGALCLG